jgi:hypothetical protein
MDSYQYLIPPAGDYNHCFCQSGMIGKSGSQSISGIYDRQSEHAYKHCFCRHKNTSLSGINPISERLDLPPCNYTEGKIREYYTLNNYTKLCSIQGNP